MSSSRVRVHDGSSQPTFLFESFCVLSAYGLVFTHLLRVFQHGSPWHWGCVIAILLGWIAADFVSGMVHWLADTWGSESLFWIGPRFLRPFRVHHVTPTSFLDCNFMDTNGDTALLGIPFLLAIFAIPLSTFPGWIAAIFLISFCLFALPTNQIHQWAHMQTPPRAVQWLQRSGLILSRVAHDRHHSDGHQQHYCITTGFCNSGLEKIRFFPVLERLVTKLTGLKPRQDEAAHAESNHVGTLP